MCACLRRSNCHRGRRQTWTHALFFLLARTAASSDTVYLATLARLLVRKLLLRLFLLI